MMVMTYLLGHILSKCFSVVFSAIVSSQSPEDRAYGDQSSIIAWLVFESPDTIPVPRCHTVFY
eukprot:scaffold6677_cov62-Alexandrium_tamarense.AAC.3